MLYSVPYIILILVFGILSLYYQTLEEISAKRKIVIVCFAIFILFFAFRGLIGDDWMNYYPVFQKSGIDEITLNVFGDKLVYEPGFMALLFICKTISGEFQFFVFICSLINTLLLFRFLSKRVDNFPLALVVYLCMGGFILHTNLMRNSISILIFINSLEFIENRKPLPYFLLCLLAISFHLSGLLFIPLYFFFHKKCNKWFFLAIFVFGNLVFLLHIHIFSMLSTLLIGNTGDKLQYMIKVYSDEFGDIGFRISIGYIERLLTGILIFCYFDKLHSLRQENTIFINAFIGYFFMYFFFSEIVEVGMRLAILFTFCYWILWLDLIKCFSIQNNRKLYIAFLLIYCILKIIGMTSLVTLNYDNVLWGAKSYQERLYIHNRVPDNNN